jgi:hypothetical protein
MKLAELVRSCADRLDGEIPGMEPAMQLVQPKGTGRFPIHGRLLCVNTQEERVYYVTVADALAYVSKALKRAHSASPEQK